MSVVYFISGGSCIKIGVSTNLKSRFASLQTSSMDDLRLLGTIPGDIEVERELHARLDKYRKRGEWFLDCAEVREAIVALCGQDVFAQIEEGPQPGPSRPLREILYEILETTTGRFAKFSNFCMEDSPTNKNSKLWRLHVTKRHLIIAALGYARNAIEREEENLSRRGDDIDAVGRAGASAECCECHVEMILGNDTWFLDGWKSEPRTNPLFETLNGKPRWETLAEAKAGGWLPPSNEFMSLAREARVAA